MSILNVLRKFVLQFPRSPTNKCDEPNSDSERASRSQTSGKKWGSRFLFPKVRRAYVSQTKHHEKAIKLPSRTTSSVKDFFLADAPPPTLHSFIVLSSTAITMNRFSKTLASLARRKQQTRSHHPDPFNPQTTKGWQAAIKVNH